MKMNYYYLSAPVSFSIKPKEEPTSTVTLKPALPLEASSDEEEQNDQRKVPKTQQQYATGKDLPLPANFQQANLQLQTSTTFSSKAQSNGSSLNTSVNEVDQSDSFIRDTILDQQNLEEKKQAKRGRRHIIHLFQIRNWFDEQNFISAEDRVKDRLAQLAREKLGIVSKEKQLQLERKKRAMAFLTQINGKKLINFFKIKRFNNNMHYIILGPSKENSTEVNTNEKQASDSNGSQMNENKEKDSDHSDSSDSVKFVSASTSIGVATHRRRNLRRHQSNDEENSDVIEIRSRNSRSRSYSSSSSRSR